jgi:hypothetical protein
MQDCPNVRAEPPAGIRSTDWFGDSVSVLFNKLMNQFLAAHYVLAAGEAGYFHVPVVEDVHFDSLANQRDSHEDSVLAMPCQAEMNVRIVQLAQQTVKRMGHTYAEQVFGTLEFISLDR